MTTSRPASTDSDSLRNALEHLAEHGTPPPGTAPIIDVGSDKFLDFFTDEVIDGLVATGGSTCRFFEGAHGSGKTHLLQLLETRARNRGMAVVRLDLSQALSLEDWRLITLYVLENLEATVDGDIIRGLPDILDVMGLAELANYDALECSTLPHPGFKTAMLRAVRPTDLSDEAIEYLRRYLLGERVGAGTLRRLGVFGVKNPLSNRNAEQVLNTVVGALHYLGLPGTMLVFDENEKTLEDSHGRSRRAQLAANLLRRLIDACFTGGLKGMVAVFGVLPGFLQACSLTYPALGERIQIARGGPYNPAWRWPVLPIEEVGTVSGPEEFLSGAIEKFLDVVRRCSGNVDGLEPRMREEGERVLWASAGSGYRRALTKALAAIAVQQT
jgi:hypothetical protein